MRARVGAKQLQRQESGLADTPALETAPPVGDIEETPTAEAEAPAGEAEPADTGGETPPGEGEDETPAAAPCDPQPLTRAQYLAHSGTSTDDLGLTVMSGTVSVPTVATRRARGGVVLERTDAVMPPIDSVYTDAGTFPEGTSHFIGDGADCPSGRYELRWTITPEGAARIREGELEHCADLQHAFAISLRRYADIVNGLAASGRVFASRRAAVRYVTRRTGAAPDDWAAVFRCLARKTEDRDFMRWHDPRVRTLAPSSRTGCAYARAIVHGSSFPHIGQHPTADLVRDCGESGGTVPEARRRRARIAKPSAEPPMAITARTSRAEQSTALLQRQPDATAPAPAAAWSPDLITIMVSSDREDRFGSAGPGFLDPYSSCGSPVRPPFCMSARVPFHVAFFVDRQNAPIAQPFTPPRVRVRVQFHTTGGARTLDTDVSDPAPRYVRPNYPLMPSFGQDFPVGSADSGTLTMRIEMLGVGGHDVVYTDTIQYIIVPCA